MSAESVRTMGDLTPDDADTSTTRLADRGGTPLPHGMQQQAKQCGLTTAGRQPPRPCDRSASWRNAMTRIFAGLFPRSSSGQATRQDSLQRECQALRRLLELEERDRELVAYDIHDGLAQFIAGALMHLQAAQREGRGEPNTTEVAEAVRLLRAAADETRRLIGDLRPADLGQRTLAEAVGGLVAEARSAGLAVDWKGDIPGERLPRAVAAAIFRIVQESLSNVRKHARATRVEVVLDRLPHGLLLRVTDDGAGFDPGSVPAGHIGLEGIHRRARLLGATSRVTSLPGSGTSIEVEFPLAES